jgi:hypothetical protein
VARRAADEPGEGVGSAGGNGVTSETSQMSSEHEVTLGSPDGQLTFARRRSREGRVVELDVVVELPGLTASYPIGSDGLHEFFESLAHDWRGWDGPREFRFAFLDEQYSHDPADRTLTCIHDGIGKVMVEVRMGHVPDTKPHLPGWFVRATVVVEPGTLPSVAQAIGQMLARTEH